MSRQQKIVIWCFGCAVGLAGGFLWGVATELRSRQHQQAAELAITTVLYDAQAGEGSAMLGMLGSLLAGPIGEGFGRSLGAAPGPRWALPGRLRPQLIGDPAGAQYVWIRPDGKTEGPFEPEKYR